jgi:hypothetical protein
MTQRTGNNALGRRVGPASETSPAQVQACLAVEEGVCSPKADVSSCRVLLSPGSMEESGRMPLLRIPTLQAPRDF